MWGGVSERSSQKRRERTLWFCEGSSGETSFRTLLGGDESQLVWPEGGRKGTRAELT